LLTSELARVCLPAEAQLQLHWFVAAVHHWLPNDRVRERLSIAVVGYIGRQFSTVAEPTKCRPAGVLGNPR
ncbi:hypothetical protein PISMIDRAFT_673768, partial [Pisolithus microcarpus 441]